MALQNTTTFPPPCIIANITMSCVSSSLSYACPMFMIMGLSLFWSCGSQVQDGFPSCSHPAALGLKPPRPGFSLSWIWHLNPPSQRLRYLKAQLSPQSINHQSLDCSWLFWTWDNRWSIGHEMGVRYTRRERNSPLDALCPFNHKLLGCSWGLCAYNNQWSIGREMGVRDTRREWNPHWPWLPLSNHLSLGCSWGLRLYSNVTSTGHEVGITIRRFQRKR